MYFSFVFNVHIKHVKQDYKSRPSTIRSLRKTEREVVEDLDLSGWGKHPKGGQLSIFRKYMQTGCLATTLLPSNQLLYSPYQST